MQTIKFNGSYVGTDGEYIVIKDNLKDMQIELAKQRPKTRVFYRTLKDTIRQTKRARQGARLVNLF